MTRFGLKIISGDFKGQTYELKEGLVLGRRKADVILNDPKTSSRHAIIEKNTENQWVIRDLNSRNGLYLGVKDDDKRIDSCVLSHGVGLQLGDTKIEIFETEDKDHWHGAALRLLYTMKPEDKALELTPFEPILILTPKNPELPQKNYYFGYGPRSLGPLSADLPLSGEGLPDICFQLVADDKAVRLKAQKTGLVKINDQFITEHLLQTDDCIEVGPHRLIVSYQS